MSNVQRCPECHLIYRHLRGCKAVRPKPVAHVLKEHDAQQTARLSREKTPEERARLRAMYAEGWPDE